MNNFSKIFKLSVLFVACTSAMGAHAENAQEAAINSPLNGGRWLTQEEAWGNKNPEILWNYVTSGLIKAFRPKNIRDVPPTTCDREKAQGNPHSVYACLGTQYYTLGHQVTTAGGKGHVPKGMLTIGHGSDNGDFVIIDAYIGEVKYVQLSPAITEPDEVAYFTCTNSTAKVSERVSIGINTSSTLGKSHDVRNTYGSSTKVANTLSTETGLSVSGEAGLGDLGKVSTEVSTKVGTSQTTEMANSHERSTGTSTTNSFTDGRIVTNDKVYETSIPPGLLVQSAQWMPHIEIYGLFRMGRTIPKNVGRFIKEPIQGNTNTGFKLAISDTAQTKEFGRPSNMWLGKITVPANSMKLPGGATATSVVGKKQTPPTIAFYKHECPDDVAVGIIADSMLKPLCTACNARACKQLAEK